MPVEVIMPQLGESVVEGTVTKWLKQVDEPVREFEPLVEINTDKVDTEVPSPANGTILARFVDEGQTVRAGTVLALIGEPGEPLPQREDGEAAPARKREDLGFISPVVAKMAAEHGLDLSQVPGTGQAGRITKKDVLAFLVRRPTAAPPAPWEEPGLGELFRPSEEVGAAKPAAAPGTILPLDVVRRSIADHMLRSRHTSAHVTTVMEADLSRVIAHRQAHKEKFQREGVSLTFTAYFAAAAVTALKQVPLVNASWSDQGIVLHRQVNVGVAVSLGDKGLIVPVIRDADQLSLQALAGTLNDLAERARSRKLRPEEVQGGTFTITNHGTSGSLLATPIINQPQSAILGVGVMQKRVVVLEGKGPTGEPADSIAIRPMVYLTLTFDHRILDGAIGDQFLGLVVQRLQQWT
ncbi:MAG TPA: dihydrolipoamide acetyltransferase family protein [Anaerolineales bacterium]|nr:dihydrolipoamide acetyltransferase family protein [Anaerolineales bacterium]